MATLHIHPLFLEEDEENVVENVVEGVVEQLTERQKLILQLIKGSVVETASTLAPKVGTSSRTVQRELATLQKMGKLSREGGYSNGRWRTDD